jgi:hypothetical protein
LLTNREGLKKEEMIAGKSSNLLTLQKGNGLNTPEKLTGMTESLLSSTASRLGEIIFSKCAAIFFFRDVRLS